MNDFDPIDLLIRAFLHLRRIGLALGFGELLDAVRAVEGGWGKDGPEALRQVARLLWGQSLESQRDFDDAWAAVSASTTRLPTVPPPVPLPLMPPAQTDQELDRPAPPPAPETGPGQPAPKQEISTLPVQAPFTPVTLDESMRLDAYWPVTRRSMSYTWRYLRRMVPNGPEGVLDVGRTVERAAQQGFYISPIFRRRLVNHAHLILLLDQGGSMVPFHRFTRDMTQTALSESTITQVEVYYFHNVISDELYLDPYLTDKISWQAAVARSEADTSVLIVSDAGASGLLCGQRSC
jgi:uncharacterized protein with von Willebrand factor type A (vWA) domain